MTLKDKATHIAKILMEQGHTTFFAGGCVRDTLLNQEPKDYDIATSATPQQVLKLFPGADSIGAHFGVILVKFEGEGFEVATFRHDGSYSDGRHPDSVTFTGPEEDAVRRDFTINGLFKNPLTGELVDFVHGVADIEERSIRAIGRPEARFQEDALRLMRAIRFATVLEFDIEPRTWKAIQQNAKLLQQVSVERIAAEFNKILLSEHRSIGLGLLVDSGLIKYFLPEVLELIGCEQPPQFHPEGDVYTHTRLMLSMLKPDANLELCLSVLLHDIGKPATYTYDKEEDRIRFNGHDAVGARMSETILTRLRYPNTVIETVSSMVANHMNFMHVQQMRTAKLKRFMARPHYEDEIELHRVDCASSNGFTQNLDFLKMKKEQFANEPLIPPALISGADLIKKGLDPGPRFKEILTSVQTEQLEGKLTTREDALEWLNELLS